MKIAYLNPTGLLGGAEWSLMEILASLRAAKPGWSQRLIVGSDGSLVSRAEALGVPTTVVRFPRTLATLGDSGSTNPDNRYAGRLGLVTGLISTCPGILTYVSKLRSILREFAPDLVHANGFKMH